MLNAEGHLRLGPWFVLFLAFPGRHCANSDPYVLDYFRFIWDRLEYSAGSPGWLAKPGRVEQSTDVADLDVGPLFLPFVS